jgi:hypothetical protein
MPANFVNIRLCDIIATKYLKLFIQGNRHNHHIPYNLANPALDFGCDGYIALAG